MKQHGGQEAAFERAAALGDVTIDDREDRFDSPEVAASLVRISGGLGSR